MHPDGELLTKLPRDEYDRLDHVNWSTLKHMARSPAHYRHALTRTEKDTDPKRLGRAVHIAVYEPDRWASAVAVFEGKQRRGAEWERFLEEHGSAEVVLKADAAGYAKAIGDAVRNDRMARAYIDSGFAEATILWRHRLDDGTTIECKGRPDFLSTAGAIVDLKSSRDASPAGFGRTAWNFQYHAQAAMYADGYAAVTGLLPPQFKLIAVESARPHLVQVYRVPGAVMDAGRAHYRGLLERLAQCRRCDLWPGYAEAEIDLEMPGWSGLSLGDSYDDLDFGSQAVADG